MKVILLNGSPNENRCTYTALNEVARTLQEEYINTEIVHINKFISDRNGIISFAKLVAEADALIVGSPVYTAGMTGELKSFLDRVFNYSQHYENKLAAAVVSCRRGGASATFDQINHFFSMSNMHIVSSQYWNQVHGNSPAEVKKDLEGMQTMRTLARNMAWLLKCIEEGKNLGIPLPKRESLVSTNFIN